MTGESQSPYQPLDTTRQQIRLLRITFNSETKVIHCDSGVFDLDTIPSYNTLSYAWGSQSDPKEVVLNGCPVRIGQNLYDFLLVFLARDSQPWIWIDQLCIDQESVTEKNHQVAMMAQIYRGSELTLVWLGPDPNNGDVVKHLTPRNFGFPGLVTTSDDELEAMHDVLRKPYWGRHWVAQELILSTRHLLLYGGLELSWDHMARLSTEFMPWGTGLSPPSKILFWVISRTDMGDVWRWCNIALFAGHSVCQDQRDKIYGSQSVLKPSLQIDVDYNLSARDIYLASLKRLVAEVPITTHLMEPSFLARACLSLASGMGIAHPQWTTAFEPEDMQFAHFLELLKTQLGGAADCDLVNGDDRVWDIEAFVTRHVLCDERGLLGTAA